MTANPVLAREYCATCEHVTKPFYLKCPKCEGDQNRARIERLAKAIRELKASVYESIDAQRERELVRALYDEHHPNPERLLSWIAAERDKALQTRSTQHTKRGHRR